jgi:lipopolysaccharide biosynthesis glycosyltransferase
MEPIVLVFAIKGNYSAHLAVALQSIFDTNQMERFEVYLLAYDVQKNDIDKLKQMFESHESTLKIIDVAIDQFKGLPISFHLDLSCYFRLLIPDIISADRAIYLDSDLVVNGSLRSLWEIELGEYFLAAAPEFSRNMHPELPFNQEFGYFNCGVMLINLKKWRKFQILESVLEFSKTNPKLIRFADQCGLNAVAMDNFLPLKTKFNFQGIFYDDSYVKPTKISAAEMENSQKKSIIIHFTGTTKPWHWSCKHPDRGLYWKYLRKTPFKRRFPENPSVISLLRWVAPKVVLEFFYQKKNRLKGLFN